MQKILLLSMVLVSIIFPSLAANDRSARRGMQKTVYSIVGFAVVYWFLLLYVYPKIFYPPSE